MLLSTACLWGLTSCWLRNSRLRSHDYGNWLFQRVFLPARPGDGLVSYRPCRRALHHATPEDWQVFLFSNDKKKSYKKVEKIRDVDSTISLPLEKKRRETDTCLLFFSLRRGCRSVGRLDDVVYSKRVSLVVVVRLLLSFPSVCAPGKGKCEKETRNHPTVFNLIMS